MSIEKARGRAVVRILVDGALDGCDDPDARAILQVRRRHVGARGVRVTHAGEVDEARPRGQDWPWTREHDCRK